MLSTEAANSTLSSIKSRLDIDDSFCTTGVKGGGKCIGQNDTATHANRFNVNVNTKATKFALTSTPIPQAVIDANSQMASGLASAYGCLGTTDITSVKEIYECMNSASKELEELAKAKKINRSKHMPVYLSNPATPCWRLSNFYKRGLSYLKNDSDTGPIPSCKTFAAVIGQSFGSLPFWSGCINEDGSDEFLKSCIDSVNPSYFKLVDTRLPTCKEYQMAYQTGVVAAKDKGINASAVTPRTVSVSLPLQNPCVLLYLKNFKPAPVMILKMQKSTFQNASHLNLIFRNWGPASTCSFAIEEKLYVLTTVTCRIPISLSLATKLKTC